MNQKEKTINERNKAVVHKPGEWLEQHVYKLVYITNIGSCPEGNQRNERLRFFLCPNKWPQPPHRVLPGQPFQLTCTAS